MDRENSRRVAKIRNLEVGPVKQPRAGLGDGAANAPQPPAFVASRSGHQVGWRIGRQRKLLIGEQRVRVVGILAGQRER